MYLFTLQDTTGYIYIIYIRTTEKGGLKNKPPFLHLFYFYITVLLFLISFARDCHISTFYTTLVFFNSAFKYKDYLVKLILKNI